MFKLKLGAKIATGFSLVLAIMVILGSLSFVEMQAVKSETWQLIEEHIPEVEIANRLEVNYLESLLDLRGYEYTRDPEFLAGANKYLHEVDTAIEQAEALIARAPHLQKLQAAIAKTKEDTHHFEQLIAQSETATEAFKASYDKLVLYGGKYMAASESFLEGQKHDMAQLIDHDGPAAELREHLEEITGTTKLLELGYQARMQVLRALAVRDQSLLDEAERSLAQAVAETDHLQQVTHSETDLKMILPIKESAQHYQADLKKLHHAWAEMDKLAEARHELSEELLHEVIGLAESGIASAIEIGKETEETLHVAMNVIVGGLIAALLLGIAIAFFLTRSLTRPIIKSVDLAKEIAKGDFGMRLNLKRDDEIGDLSKALDSMADSLQKTADLAETIADGNLSVEVPLASEKDQLGLALQKMTDSLNEILSQVLVSGEQIASGSTQVADSSQSLSQGATEQASSLEEISSSMAEINSQTGLNAENAGQATHLARQAGDAAENGNQQMQDMTAAMSEINNASQDISKIIKVIDEIAFQTNLLALNAAVEAARAGQHGKGFAVVAEEVRNLAARSAKAASETADLIEGSVEKSRNGTAIADRTAGALSEIVTSVTKVNDLIQEIATSSQEQSEGLNQISQGLTQIDQVTQQNTANSEESAAAAEELSGQAMQMQQMLQRFTLRQAFTSASPAASLRQPEKSPEVGWNYNDLTATGTTPKAQPKPSAAANQIALDDNEFGKY